MAIRDPHRQRTYRVDELRAGAIYRDALSGYLVLVRKAMVKEMRRTHSHGLQEFEVERLVGWYYNPTLGQHKEMDLHDHQLISAEYKTDLKPDTRYDERLSHG